MGIDYTLPSIHTVVLAVATKAQAARCLHTVIPLGLAADGNYDEGKSPQGSALMRSATYVNGYKKICDSSPQSDKCKM